MNEDRVTYFAEADFRNSRTKFGIKAKDRTKHVYVIGKTGMGKSTLLENMAAQDIMNGEGMAFIDPHGSAIDKLLQYVPEHRIRDVVYFAPFDTDYPVAFNVMEDVGADTRHLVVNGLMSAFKKIWQDAWSARMEYILSNTLLALLEYPGSTLLSVNRMLAEKHFRSEVIKHTTDATVKAFWVDEYNKWDERYAREAAAAIQNKVGQFTASPLIRNIVGQKHSSFDIREMMDNKKILLINLSKGRIGEQNANLLGGMLITKIYIAAMSRAEVGEGSLKSLPQFYMYVDEFQNFANESFADILSEARKYRLNLTIAHQYVEQMQEEVKDAVMGNVGTMITFRIGAADAELFEKEFSPVFTVEDLVNLGFAQIYLRLMIDGIGSRPFSAKTLPPIEPPETSFAEQVVAHSRMKYAVPRNVIEDEIKEWYKPLPGYKEGTDKKNNKNRKETIQTFVPKTPERETKNGKVNISPKLERMISKIDEENFNPSDLQKEKPKNQKTNKKRFNKNKQRYNNFQKSNNNSLKDVLDKVIKEGKKEVSEEEAETSSKKNSTKREIPEDVLRRVLE